MFNTYLMVLNTILLSCIILFAALITFTKNKAASIVALFVIGILLSFEFLFFRAFILAILQAILGGIVIPIAFLKAEKRIDLKEDK